MTLTIVINTNNNTAPFFLNDRIFLGEGLLETIRVNHSKPCYANWHLERLREGANFLHIPFKLTFEKWQDCLDESIQKANLVEGGIKILLSGGPAARGLANYSHDPCLQINAFHYQVSTSLIKLASIPWLRDARNPMYYLKSINYLEAIIALRHIEQYGADEALFFNTEKHVTETSIANFFIVINDTLYTPQLSCGVLNGITRRRILQAAQQLSINYAETTISLSMLSEASSVFLSNALQVIRTVSSLDNTYFFNSTCDLKNTLINFLSD